MEGSCEHTAAKYSRQGVVLGLGRISWKTTEELTEELHTLFPSADAIRVIKTGKAERVERRGLSNA
jgi:hypothetical protein